MEIGVQCGMAGSEWGEVAAVLVWAALIEVEKYVNQWSYG